MSEVGLELPGKLAQKAKANDLPQSDDSISTVETRSEIEALRKNLLAKVTKSNIHKETDSGVPVGKETW
ncbi:MAG: hypothetical protein WKF92_04950 [Pyrinomonadaceae bacterium]